MDPRRSATFHDHIAPDYDRRMSSSDDAAVRRAFHAFVSGGLAAGTRILDFGCGTGTDASWYADQGFRVLAFDNSPGMIGELRRGCAGAIARGQVEPWNDSYDAFLAQPALRGEVDVVTANFAVVNLLPDLEAWFSVVGRALSPKGAVFLSALNPISLRDLRAPRTLLRSLRCLFAEGVPYPETLNPHVKYWPWVVARAARGFRLRRIAGAATFRGEGRFFGVGREHAFPERLGRVLGARRPWSYLGRFIFLELRRC